MTLIDDVRDWWRMWSMRLMGLAAVAATWPESFLSIYALVPADLQEFLPRREVFVALCVVLAMIARIIKQKKPEVSDGDQAAG